MKSFARFAAVCGQFMPYLTIIAALVSTCDALAVGGIASVSIIDRETGEVLPTHYYQGEYWVAGKPGARYGIEVHNTLGGRVLAVTSVDGVNVVSGATAAWNQTGYVLDGGQKYEITGWRKSDTHIAAFTFTDSSRSYASKTGRPANIGVIGVAVFREKQPVIYEAPPAVSQNLDRERADASNEPSSRDSTLEEVVVTQSSGAPAPAAKQEARSAPHASASAASVPELASKLGTGHGAREYSYVMHTDFERLQPQPNEVIQIHYDSLANLIAMGIVRRPPPVRPSPNPFPDSPSDQYVPDPPG